MNISNTFVCVYFLYFIYKFMKNNLVANKKLKHKKDLEYIEDIVG